MARRHDSKDLRILTSTGPSRNSTGDTYVPDLESRIDTTDPLSKGKGRAAFPTDSKSQSPQQYCDSPAWVNDIRKVREVWNDETWARPRNWYSLSIELFISILETTRITIKKEADAEDWKIKQNNYGGFREGLKPKSFLLQWFMTILIVVGCIAVFLFVITVDQVEGHDGRSPVQAVLQPLFPEHTSGYHPVESSRMWKGTTSISGLDRAHWQVKYPIAPRPVPLLDKRAKPGEPLCGSGDGSSGFKSHEMTDEKVLDILKHICVGYRDNPKKLGPAHPVLSETFFINDDAQRLQYYLLVDIRWLKHKDEQSQSSVCTGNGYDFSAKNGNALATCGKNMNKIIGTCHKYFPNITLGGTLMDDCAQFTIFGTPGRPIHGKS